MRRWKKRAHTPVWITPRDLQEEGIIISAHMMVDHFPDVVAAALERTVHEARARRDGVAKA